MQPVLSVSCDVPGMICLNGRMAGETDGARPLALPVSPFGAVILEHRPFGSGWLPLCARLTFSGGEPVPASLEEQRGVSAVCWPGGVVELALEPVQLHGPEQVTLEAGMELRLNAGGLFCRSATGCALCETPRGAELPQVHRLPGAIILTGACPGGRFAAVLDEACRRVLFCDHAREASLQPDGTLRLLRALNDMPGHAQAEIWLPGETMDAPLSVEPAWLEGGPRAPASPLDVALTAARSAQLDGMDEAMACFHPAAPCREALAAAAAFDGALPLKFPAPDGKPCIGLVKALCDRMIRVVPAAYRCSPGGRHGWQLEELEIENYG